MSMGFPALKPLIFAWQTSAMNPLDANLPADHQADHQADDPASAQTAYWRRTQRLTGALLLVWALIAFGMTYFARALSFKFFGWPFSFWVAAQGAILVFLAIVAYYAYAMRRLDEAQEPH